MSDIKRVDGDAEFGEGITGWGRARSGVALLVLLTVLGALLAVIVLIAGAVALTGIRTTVQ
jgi:hypothetical protein